jgi:hypothetical protein
MSNTDAATSTDSGRSPVGPWLASAARDERFVWRGAAVVLLAVPILDQSLPRISIGAGGLSVADGCMFATTLPIVMAALRGRVVVVPHRLVMWVLALAALSALFVFGETRGDGRGLGLRQAAVLCLAGLYVSSVVIVVRAAGLKFCLQALVALATLNAIIIILAGLFPNQLGVLSARLHVVSRKVSSFKLPFRRNAGLMSTYAYSALYTLAGLASARYLRHAEPRQWYSAASALLVVSAFVTQSRSTWLAVILYAAVAVYCGPVTRGVAEAVSGRRRVGFGLLAVTLAVPAGAGLMALVRMVPATVYARLYQYRVAWELFTSSPIAGTGYHAFLNAHRDHVVHNMFLTVLYSTGCLGLAAMAAVIGLPYVSAPQGRPRAWALSVGVPSLAVVSGASGLSYYSGWLVLGLMLAMGPPRVAPARQKDGLR